MSHFEKAKNSILFRTVISFIAVCVVLVSVAATQKVFAAPPANGVYGMVIKEDESSIIGARVEVSCDNEGFNWYAMDWTDEGGEFDMTGSALGAEPVMGYAGCVDGVPLYIRATADGYVDSIPQLIATINLLNVDGQESFSDWAERVLSPAVHKVFVLEESNTPADGWYGVVQDDESGDSIFGAEFTIACDTQDSYRSLVTSDEEGYYEISQSMFVSQLNSLGCYYDSTFNVEITISAEGYESELYRITEVSLDDQDNLPFEDPSEMNFYLYPPEIDPATFFNRGDGSIENPFVIETKEQWNKIPEFENNAEGLYFVLDTDIEFDETYDDPISFDGNLDGANHVMTGLSAPLFSSIDDDARVQNLIIENSTLVVSDQGEVGVLTNVIREGAHIESVHVSGSLSASGSYCASVGGFAGYVRGATIYRSSANVAVSAAASNCHHIGGFVGRAQDVVISESYAIGAVSGGSGVGGFAGIFVGSEGDISDSYATGSVTASDNEAGGFFGYLGARALRVFSTGSVTTVESSYIGGFAGSISEGGSLSNSFTVAATVSGNQEVGGLVGSYSDGSIHNSAWVVIPDTYAVGMMYGYNDCGTDTGADTSKGLLAGSGACDLGHDFANVSLLKRDGYNGGLAPVYLDGEESWDFATVWKFDPAVNEGLPSLRWGMQDDDIEYVITATANAGGGISPSGQVQVPQGTNQTFTITPNSGYSIANVKVGDDNLGAISTYTFTNVQSVHTITASFTKNPVSSGGGSSRVSGGRSSTVVSTTTVTPPAPVPPTPSEQSKQQCPSDQTLTQNMKAGARNGRTNAYSRAVVTEVALLQAHMNRLGFNAGPVDGILGPLTDGAIKRMQTFLGTKADGMVGPLTRALINTSCGSTGLQKTV